MTPPKYIHLIRHGQTESNKKAITQEPDEPLTELGRAQAILVADRIAKHFHTRQPIEKIVVSTLRRSIETAEYIQNSCEKTLPLTVNSDFNECAQDEPFQWRHARAQRALKALKTAEEQHIVVVGHNIINNMLLGAMMHGSHLTRELLEATQFYFPNTGLITVQYRKPSSDGARSGWCIVAGDTSHLFGLEI